MHVFLTLYIVGNVSVFFHSFSRNLLVSFLLLEYHISKCLVLICSYLWGKRRPETCSFCNMQRNFINSYDKTHMVRIPVGLYESFMIRGDTKILLSCSRSCRSRCCSRSVKPKESPTPNTHGWLIKIINKVMNWIYIVSSSETYKYCKFGYCFRFFLDTFFIAFCCREYLKFELNGWVALLRILN